MLAALCAALSSALLEGSLPAHLVAQAPRQALVSRAPRQALLDERADVAVVSRAQPRGEPLRGVASYAASLAAFTALNAGGSLLLSSAHATVSKGHLSLDGSEGALVAAGSLFLLSPLAAALGSWVVGNGSDVWEPSLGWASLGAYGSSLLAIGGGYLLAGADVSRDTAVAANAALYLAVPLATVLVQNATKSERP